MKKKEKRKYSRLGSIAWALKRLWILDKRFVFFIFAAVPVGVILPILNSYFSKVLIDSIGRNVPFASLCRLLIFFMAITLLLTLLNQYIYMRCQARRYYPTMIYQSEMAAIEGRYTDYENLEKQDFRKVSGYAWGDCCQGDAAVEFLWEDLSNALKQALGIFTYASILVLLNPILFAVVAAVSVLSYFTTRWQFVYYEKNKHHWEKEGRKKDYLQGLSGDFSKAKDIKLYGLAPWLGKMMQDYQAYLLMWNKRCSLRGVWASILSGVMSFVQNGAAYLILVGILLDGALTVGEFVFYFGLVGSIAGFLQGIMGSIAQLNSRADKIDYYRDFFCYPNHFNHQKGCPLPEAPVKIELKDVWYRYHGAENDTLKGISLVIEGGESFAIVGANGAGKTTLIKLICGMYTPTKGEILVNGKKIEEYNIEEYYSLISAVFQEIHAVAFTVFEFVASSDLRRKTAREDAISAMKRAGIYDKIEHLTNGMDTHLMKGIYDDGVDLSGGEMQKLVLARAIYKNGAIFVLDEPTAALDPIAENQLYLQYHALTQGKTSLYISHRFASTRFCDKIILLDDGVIRESGTHDELMRQGGQYAYLFGVQSKYYREGEENA